MTKKKTAKKIYGFSDAKKIVTLKLFKILI